MKNRNKLLRRHSNSAAILQLTADCLTTSSLLYGLSFFKNGSFDIQYSTLLVMSLLVMSIIYQFTGQYTKNQSHTSLILSRIKAWSYVLIILLFIGFVTKGISYYSREVLIIWSISSLLAQYLSTLLIVSLSKKRVKSNKKQALVIGASQSMLSLTTAVNHDKWMDYEIIGYIDANKSPIECNIPYLGEVNQLDDVIEKYNIRHIYITLPIDRLALLKSLYTRYMLKDIGIHWVPDLVEMNLINHHAKEISGMPIITLAESPLVGNNLLLKSTFDIVLASLGVIPVSPLLLLVAVLIKLSSRGPILFCQERHGWNNEIFQIYKFRSMKVHQENKGEVTQATQGDSRPTKIGGFIRRTSIDELPQLFNVLKGDMSLVGPRPHAVAHNDYYQKEIDNYLARHKIKPGITGLAQTTGFRGETDTLDKMSGRVQKDINPVHFQIRSFLLMLFVLILYVKIFKINGIEANFKRIKRTK